MGLASTKVPLNTKRRGNFVLTTLGTKGQKGRCSSTQRPTTPIWWQNVYFSTKRQL